MIFLTIGTHEPFDRLVRAVDDWCATRGRADVFGQITDRAIYLPRHFEHVGQIAPAAYRDACEGADFLIAHAGMGAIITALTLAKAVAVMPRRSHLGETRNDHQFATAARLGAKPGVHVAATEAELPAVLDRLAASTGAAAAPAIGQFAEESLISALRSLIEQRDERIGARSQPTLPELQGMPRR